MYYLIDMCCICLCHKKILEQLNSEDDEGVTYYQKLFSCISEINSEGVDAHHLICKKCRDTLNLIYKFREQCLKNTSVFQNYVLKLNSSKRVNLHVELTDIGYGRNYFECSEKKLNNISQVVDDGADSDVILIETESNADDDNVTFNNDEEIGNGDFEYIVVNPDIGPEVVYGDSDDDCILLPSPVSCEPEGSQESKEQQDYIVSNGELNTAVKKEEYDTALTKEEFEIGDETFTMPLEYNSVNIGDLNGFVGHTLDDEREKPFQCETCFKRFKRKDKLQLHRRIHTGEKPYPCTICDARFIRKDKLTTHMRVHTGEKPYQCKFCVKKFSRADKLKRHAETHFPMRLFHCNVCGKSFVRKDTLNLHLRRHYTVKVYECIQCSETFMDKTKLTEHKSTHSSSDPYVCSKCSETFVKYTDFLQHAQIHSNAKRYECNRCGKSYARSNNLKKHRCEMPSNSLTT